MKDDTSPQHLLLRADIQALSLKLQKLSEIVEKQTEEEFDKEMNDLRTLAHQAMLLDAEDADPAFAARLLADINEARARLGMPHLFGKDDVS